VTHLAYIVPAGDALDLACYISAHLPPDWNRPSIESRARDQTEVTVRGPDAEILTTIAFWVRIVHDVLPS
jgi:hypothetical protein